MRSMSFRNVGTLIPKRLAASVCDMISIGILNEAT